MHSSVKIPCRLVLEAKKLVFKEQLYRLYWESVKFLKAQVSTQLQWSIRCLSYSQTYFLRCFKSGSYYDENSRQDIFRNSYSILYEKMFYQLANRKQWTLKVDCKIFNMEAPFRVSIFGSRCRRLTSVWCQFYSLGWKRYRWQTFSIQQKVGNPFVQWNWISLEANIINKYSSKMWT